MASCIAMIAACGKYQVAASITVDCGTPPREPALQGGPSLAPSDTGIDGHADQRVQSEDRRDDGQTIDDPAA